MISNRNMNPWEEIKSTGNGKYVFYKIGYFFSLIFLKDKRLHKAELRKLQSVGHICPTPVFA